LIHRGVFLDKKKKMPKQRVEKKSRVHKEIQKEGIDYF